MDPLEPTLSRALEALHSRNSALALQLLIACWRDCRSPRLSDAIFQLSHQISALHGPVLGDGPAFHQAWMDREAAGDPLDVDVLCPGLLSLPAVTLVLRIERMIRRGPDPRTALALYRVISQVPTTALSNYSVYKTVFAALGGPFRDPQHRELLHTRIQTRVGGDTFWPKFESGIVRLLKTLGEPDVLGDREAAILALIEARIPLTHPVPLGEGVAMIEVDPQEAERPVYAVLPRTLGGAMQAWDEQRRGEALEIVLEVWRAHRTRALGELAEAMGKLLPARCLPGLKASERAENWLSLEERRQLADLPTLLSTVAEGTVSVFEERLRRLISWPADPRIGSRIVEAVSASWYSNYRTLLWKLLEEGLVLHGDERLFAYLDENGVLIDRTMYKLTGGLTRARNVLRVTPLSEGDAACVAELARRVAGVPDLERGLVEAIYADPESDGPRLVYADWLSEREDPRGELIMLQCSPAQRGTAKRVSALLANPKVLLGPLDAIVKNPIFERGFLTKFELALTSPMVWNEFKDDPRLVAVRSITLGWYHHLNGIRLLYDSRWMGQLTSLSGINRAYLEDLAGDCLDRQDRGLPGLALTHLGITGYGDDREWKNMLSERCFPHLRSFSVTGWSVREANQVAGAWFWQLPLLRRVARFQIEIGVQDVAVRAATYRHLTQLPGRISSICITEWGARNPREVARNPDGSWPDTSF